MAALSEEAARVRAARWLEIAEPISLSSHTCNACFLSENQFLSLIQAKLTLLFVLVAPLSHPP